MGNNHTLSDGDLYKRAEEYLTSDLEAIVRQYGKISCSFKVRGIGKRRVRSEEVFSVEIQAECGLTPEQVRVVEDSVGKVLEKYGFGEKEYIVSADSRAIGKFIVRIGAGVGERL